MASDKHVKLLERGPDAWNSWRAQNPQVKPDLAFLNLRNAKLAGLNLWHANLSGVNFRKVDLAHADLTVASLSDAKLALVDLTSAKLDGAVLQHAYISSVNLRKATLRGAEFRSAILKSSILDDADLSFSRFDATIISNIDLSTVSGLDKIKHNGPSTIGMDTIYRSKGKILGVFLRGAGLPDSFITYMHSLVTNGFEYYSCFISYSSKDQEFVTRLHADLQSKGVRCWFAPEDLRIGDKLRQSFDEAIRLHDKLMVVLSESSVKSSWVEKEVETAFEKERQQNRIVLFPIRLDDSVMETKQAWAADIRRTRHVGDFGEWKNYGSYKKAFERLLRDLKSETKAGSAVQT